jgi:hypothetical protein
VTADDRMRETARVLLDELDYSERSVAALLARMYGVGERAAAQVVASVVAERELRLGGRPMHRRVC